MIDIKDFLERVRKIKILVIGDVMLDEYVWGKVDRISPEGPVPIVEVDHKEYRLGGAANVALNLAKLNVQVAIASVTGNDFKAKALSDRLKNSKIDHSAIVADSSRITTCKTRVIARNQQMLRMDEEIKNELNKETAKKFLSSILKVINKFKPDAIIFEDYDKGVLNKEVIKEVITVANKKGIITTVDPKKQHFFDYSNVTLFKPNLRELREALHIEIEPVIASLNAANATLFKKIKYDNILITLSEHGVYHASKKNSEIIPGYRLDISDVSGAGDTVIAVATAAIAAGYELNDAASVSNLAGALVCEYAGVVPIIPQLLKQAAEHSLMH